MSPNEIIQRLPLYNSMINFTMSRRQKKEFKEWEKKGRPDPVPHLVKQRTIRTLADTFGLTILVETGTYYGDMIETMKGHFNQIYSIELSLELYKRAMRRFHGDARIKLIQGDSGSELKKVLNEINQPALFWLDGHYSAGITARGIKDTPIYEELNHIFNTQQTGHVIVIDDARCFGSDPAYPTIEDLKGFIRSRRPDAVIEVEYDSITITQRRAA